VLEVFKLSPQWQLKYVGDLLTYYLLTIIKINFIRQMPTFMYDVDELDYFTGLAVWRIFILWEQYYLWYQFNFITYEHVLNIAVHVFTYGKINNENWVLKVTRFG
jgi:hypothetical protein